MLRAHRSCLVAALALGAVLTPARARACQCAHPKSTPRVAIEEADLVVEARVDSHAFTAERGFVTELSVARTHKGTRSKQLVLTASKTCAASFEPGVSYLVYAWADGDAGFSTSYCTRTAPLADAGEDLRELGRRARARASSSRGTGSDGIAAAWRAVSLRIARWPAAVWSALERRVELVVLR